MSLAEPQPSLKSQQCLLLELLSAPIVQQEISAFVRSWSQAMKLAPLGICMLENGSENVDNELCSESHLNIPRCLFNFLLQALRLCHNAICNSFIIFAAPC